MEDYGLEVQFVNTAKDLVKGTTLVVGDGYVDILCLHVINGDPCVISKTLWRDGKTTKILVNDIESSISILVDRYNHHISNWYRAIEDILEDRESFLKNCSDIEELTVADFKLEVTMREHEGMTLCNRCVLVQGNYKMVIGLQDPNPEEIAYHIRKAHGVK